MATKVEVSNLIQDLRASYPAINVVDMDRMIRVWFEKLHKFPIGQLSMGVDRIIESNQKFFPSIGEVLHAVRKSRQDYVPEGKQFLINPYQVDKGLINEAERIYREESERTLETIADMGLEPDQEIDDQVWLERFLEEVAI